MSINQRHSHSWRWWDWEKIDYKNLKNLPDLSAVKYFQDNDTRWTWAYTAWDFTVTSWFPPKRIDIKSSFEWNNEWASIWTAIINDDWTIENGCIFVDWSFTTQWRTQNWIIWAIKAWASSTVFEVTAVSSTGFTLNVNNNNWPFNTIITVQW